MSGKRLCQLLCVKKTHDPIQLPHGKPVIVGRSRETQIAEQKVSRNQVELIADCDIKEVKVKQLGVHPSSLDGMEIPKGSTATLIKGSTLCLLADKYPHHIRFYYPSDSPKTSDAAQVSEKKTIADFFAAKPKKEKLDKTKEGHKRNAEENTGDSPKHKKVKIEDRNEKNVKRGEMSDSGDSDAGSDQMENVKEQLKLMKEKASKLSDGENEKQSPSSNGCVEVPERHGQPTTTSCWKEHDKLLEYTTQGVVARSKIAAFDIDGVIICTASGKVFPTHPGDWQIMLTETPKRLKKLFKDGHKIVFFTNQSGISKGKVKLPDYKQKIESLTKKIGVPIQVFASTAGGKYRKPGLGMWKFLVEKSNDNIEVDISKSFYVGDAAGRPKDWARGRKKDFACSDRLFALNAGLTFYTPEEFFLSYKKAPFNMPEFDPRKLDSSAPMLSPPTAELTSSTQEVIVCVGLPACGKSFFSKQHIVPKGYIAVNRDTLGTWQKCVAACQKALAAGKSVVIDNTNIDPESRMRYLSCAKAARVPCRCFHFTTSDLHCRHNERFRQMVDSSHQAINDMIFHSTKKKFKEPQLSEGFTEIVKVNFVPIFKDPELETLYRHFLLEK